jgi:hypothetical protein
MRWKPEQIYNNVKIKKNTRKLRLSAIVAMTNFFPEYILKMNRVLGDTLTRRFSKTNGEKAPLELLYSALKYLKLLHRRSNNSFGNFLAASTQFLSYFYLRPCRPQITLITFRKEKVLKFTLFYFNLLLGLEVK